MAAQDIQSKKEDVTGRRVLVLEAGRTASHYWRDLWAYRELFMILAWRDIAVQYKQTAIGAAWAIVRPLLTMVVFTIIFGRIAKLPSEGDAPYPVMVMAGTLPWFLLSTILIQSSNSLVQNNNLISKVYFPRLVVPVASAVVAIVDFAVTFLLLIGLMLLFGFLPDWRLFFLPIFAALAVLTALGPGLLLAALNVKYRDFRFILPFIVQFGLYLSPVGFASSNVPDEWRILYSVNPAVGVIDGFRWSLLAGQSDLYLPGLAFSLAVTMLMLWLGIRQFRASEKIFADLI